MYFRKKRKNQKIFLIERKGKLNPHPSEKVLISTENQEEKKTDLLMIFFSVPTFF